MNQHVLFSSDALVPSSPESQLWLAAIHTHLMVATKARTNLIKDYEVQKSRDWLTGSQARRTVAMLGLDPDLYGLWINEIAENDWQAPPHLKIVLR